ncbi:ImmA/IrrE family metallo-endopeptidase [Rubrobacter indicoceani]|uniref:ImmA/IrrE family metallo-endopeptidase n=1 Tax=Rubrobacter indicoceani TaxID=2051957 RepID=UPI000E5ABA52|nr:ImmA/IrrE family metallo-endopeptidase [Rubrobacter indicoceani]
MGTRRALLELGPETFAAEARQRLGLGVQPVWDMVALMEEEGIFVVEAPFESNNLFGAFTYSQEIGSCVLINTHCTKGRQTTTAAHEYCHSLKDREMVKAIVCGRHNENEEVERYAYAFARHFLMPREGVLQVLDDLGSLSGGIDEKTVIHLRWHFRVSYSVALLHLMQLGFVKRSDYDRLKDIGSVWSLDRRLGYNPDEDRKEELKQDEEPLRRPRPLVELAVRSYENERITLSRFAEVMGIDRVAAADFLEEVGVPLRLSGQEEMVGESRLA